MIKIVRLIDMVEEKFCCTDCPYSWEDRSKDLNCADFCPVLREARRKYNESKSK
jgi:hypothetical protein